MEHSQEIIDLGLKDTSDDVVLAILVLWGVWIVVEPDSSHAETIVDQVLGDFEEGERVKTDWSESMLLFVGVDPDGVTDVLEGMGEYNFWIFLLFVLFLGLLLVLILLDFFHNEGVNVLKGQRLLIEVP